MQNRLKPALSFLCISLFLLIALGSEFLAESTNTLVLAEDCEEMPPVTGNLTITVEYRDHNNAPIQGALVFFFISHQLLKEEVTCIAEVKESELFSLVTNSLGKCTYTIPQSFTHRSNADLYRVQIKVNPNVIDNIGEYEETKVAVYSVKKIEFSYKTPKPL